MAGRRYLATSAVCALLAAVGFSRRAMDHFGEAADHADSAVREASLAGYESVKGTGKGLMGLFGRSHEEEASHAQYEHPRFYDLRHRRGAAPDSHRLSSDAGIQEWMRQHGLDSSSVDTGASDTSVLGRMKEGLSRGAERLGLKTEEPYHTGEGEAEAGSTLADRLTSSWASLRGHASEEHAAAADEASEEHARFHVGDRDVSYDQLAAELAKAAGVIDRSLVDRMKDVLETLHVKRVPPAKALARDIASHHAGDLETQLDALSPEERSALYSGSLPGGVWSSFLKRTGLKEKGPLEKAADAYSEALHEMKVAIGSESPYATERLEHAYDAARNAVASTVSAPASESWFGSHEESAVESHPSFGGRIAEGARSAWHDATARTLATTMNARDATISAYDAALRRVGLRPEERSRLQRARDELDTATARLWSMLGYGPQPTRWERLKSYTREGAHRLSPRNLHAPAMPHMPSVHLPFTHPYEEPEAAHGFLSSYRHGASDLASRTGHRISDTYDASLKKAGLRPHSYSEYLTSMPLARSAFNDALHRVRVSLGREEPSALEKVEGALSSARDRVTRTTEDLYDSIVHLPSSLSPSKIMHGGTPLHTAQQISEQAAESYALAIEKAREQLDSSRSLVDRALKGAGLREKGAADRISSQMDSAWHDLAHALGVSGTASGGGPTTMDALRYGSSGGSLADRFLKQVGLRDRSSLETAADGVYRSIHALKTAVGAEDPSTAEKLGSAISESQRSLRSAMSSLTSYLPSSLTPPSSLHLSESVKSGLGYPSGAMWTSEGLSETGRAYYEDALNRAVESVNSARSSVDKTLRSSSNRAVQPAVKAARKALDLQLSALLNALSTTGTGADASAALPSMPGGYSDAVHKAKMFAGYEEPTMKEKLAGWMHASGAGGGAHEPEHALWGGRSRKAQSSLWSRMKGGGA